MTRCMTMARSAILYAAFFAFASCIARHTRSGVSGMLRCVMPYSDSASTTALTMQTRLPAQPASPQPLVPSGFDFAGEGWSPICISRHVFRARQRVVHERAGDRLAAGVVADFLHQRLADALRDAAMQLAFDDHRVDDGAEIVDARCSARSASRRSRDRSRLPRHGSRSGRSTVFPWWRGRRRARRARPSGILLSRSRCASSMMPIERSVPAMVKRPLANSMSPSDASSNMRRRLFAFFDHERGSFHDRLTGRGDRARAAGAVAEAHEIAVVLLDRDFLEGHAELGGKHLRERRCMALAVIERAGGQFHAAVRLERDLAEFAARRRGDLEIGADGDAAQLAVLPALLLALGEIVVVGNLQRLVEDAGEIAAVIGDAGGRRERQAAPA